MNWFILWMEMNLIKVSFFTMFYVLLGHRLLVVCVFFERRNFFIRKKKGRIIATFVLIG